MKEKKERERINAEITESKKKEGIEKKKQIYFIHIFLLF
jgi:hypothetical protein